MDILSYWLILIPLAIIAISLVWQVITKPHEIPNIFGYKMFIIFDQYMDDSIKEGDVVFTKNVNPDKLASGNIIAFRNGQDTVTIHKIIKVDEDKNSKFFKMNTLDTETNDTRYVKEKSVEGLMIFRIPKIGAILYFIQQPPVMVGGMLLIIACGLVWIYIAGKLDERDLETET